MEFGGIMGNIGWLLGDFLSLFWPFVVLFGAALIVEWYRLPLTFSKVREEDKIPFQDGTPNKKQGAYANRILWHLALLLFLAAIFVAGTGFAQWLTNSGAYSQQFANVMYIVAILFVPGAYIAYLVVLVKKTARYRRIARRRKSSDIPMIRKEDSQPIRTLNYHPSTLDVDIKD